MIDMIPDCPPVPKPFPGNWAAGFFRSQLSDKDGTVSNTKVLLLIIIVNVMAWISALVGVYVYYVAKIHASIGMTDIVAFLSSVGTFATMLCGVLAGMKYSADAVNNRAPNASPQVQPPDPKQETK
jgi:hypothetical protein